MNDSRPAAEGVRRAGAAGGRLRNAWRGLPGERRLAAVSAFALFLTLFLPWYQETVIASGSTPALRSASASLTGWGAFSFVEAAVLLVAAGVLLLLFVRAEERAFHVPGGDGGVIAAAGLWTCALIVWRMFDKEGTTGHGQYATTSGIEWGIFVALGVAGLLAYAGSQIRRAHEPEPPLPGEAASPGGDPEPWAQHANAWDARDARGAPAVRAAPAARARRRRPAVTETERPTEPQIRPHLPRVARDGSSRRGLNFSDLDEIEFDEPPEVPTVHRRPPDPPPSEEPAVAPPLPGAHDQLTIRLDGTD